MVRNSSNCNFISTDKPMLGAIMSTLNILLFCWCNVATRGYYALLATE